MMTKLNLSRVVTSALVISWISWICSVESFCRIQVRELYAYSNPDTEFFHDEYTKYISSDKGEECRWIITSSSDDEVVKLSFPDFELKNTTGTQSADCLTIYDGRTTDASVLDKLCGRLPKEYTSEGRFLLVVYERGEVTGHRSFSMSYYSKSVLTKAKIIRIAGIIGASLAVIGLTYVIFRATKCCRCLRGKNSGGGTSNTLSSMRERDRLTQVVVDDTDNTTNQNASQRLTTPSNTGGASPSASHNSAVGNGGGHESDTDSLQDMNEPPPSYESLYLNEQGEAVSPPKYSPPQHRTTHPPRRVHTFN